MLYYTYKIKKCALMSNCLGVFYREVLMPNDAKEKDMKDTKDINENLKRQLAAHLECGKIINTHGLDGTLKLESYCDSPDVLADLEYIYFKDEKSGEMQPRHILRASVHKRFVLMHIEGVDTPEAADALRETIVYAAREDLPIAPGAHFIVDLIGLPVIDADSGLTYGRISYVFNAGASDIYTIETPSGERMMPAVPEFVIRIDIERGVFVRPIEGMFD